MLSKYLVGDEWIRDGVDAKGKAQTLGFPIINYSLIIPQERGWLLTSLVPMVMELNLTMIQSLDL